MKILLTFNESYAPHAASVITGLLKYSSVPLSLVVLYSEMKNDSISKFKDYYKNRLQSIDFIKVDIHGEIAEKFKRIKSQFHLSGRIEPYLRLFAPLYIEDDEVIYLDCDIVVLGDINEILDEVNYDCCVSGVREHDPMHKLMNYSNLDKYTEPYSYKNYMIMDAHYYRLKRFYGMKCSSSYMCDGIMHMNLKKWRKENLFEKLMKRLNTTDYFLSADQDLLNSVIDGEFGVLKPAWNTIVNGSGIMSNYSSEEFREAFLAPKIVHMPGIYKPWNKRLGGPYRKIYWEYRMDTPWPEKFELPICKYLFMKLKKYIKCGIVHVFIFISRINRTFKKEPDNIFLDSFCDRFDK